MNQNNQTEQYLAILPQLEALITSDTDLPIATLSNTCAVLKETFGWFWVGFYLLNRAETELQLSVFQGTVACTRIAKGRGVCGQSWVQNQTLIVPNVHEHPDHIACSSLSQSEIVLPVYRRDGRIVGVLDVDDVQLNRFNEVDAKYLRQICDLLSQHIEFDTLQAA